MRFGSAALVALGCAVACSGEGPQSSISGTAGRAALPSACSPGVATYTDDDGDGFYGKYGPTLCPGDQVPEGYILVSSTPERDCDDSDPTETSGLMYFLDSDGDGYGNPGLAGTWACPDNPPFGRVSNQIDCDDTDPSGVTSESDDDGDGYHPFCETHQARNPALAQLDCDDHDATRNPRAGELASDGIDSNCDGYDFPFIHDCSALPELAPSALRPRSECTDQSDLALLAVSDCWSCQDHYVDVIVANRGSTPAYAVLSLGDDPSFDVLVGQLPPLSISAPTRIQTTPYPPPYTLRVHERGDPPRCAATDDSVVLVDKLFCDP